MKISSKSQWDESEIRRFLNNATIPMRLSFMNKNGEPMICSLWFKFIDDSLWSASHQNAYVVNQLKNNSKVSFEISTNEYPYKGVRGKAEVELSKLNADNVLAQLSLLQKAHCVGGFLRREAKAEGAGGHFWHDAVTKPNIITPAP